MLKNFIWRQTKVSIKKEPRTIIKQDLLWPTPLYHTVLNDFKIHPTKINFNEDMINYANGLKEKNVNVTKERYRIELEDKRTDDIKFENVKLLEVCGKRKYRKSKMKKSFQ